MDSESSLGRAILKLGGKSPELLCDIVQDEPPHVVLAVCAGGSAPQVNVGGHVALIERRKGQIKARSGTIASVTDGRIAIQIEPGSRHDGNREPRLTDCQLPAMYRPLSQDGHFGSWRGGIIVRHSPSRLHIQIEEGAAVPYQAELMFSPIGSESPSSHRTHGDEGGLMNASDVRSRRIRVRATTRDVLPAPAPGTVTLVVDISRTLYRAA